MAPGILRAMDFMTALLAMFSEAERSGFSSVEVNAGNLHARVGRYPGPDHRMPLC